MTLTDERAAACWARQHPGGDLACRAHVAGGARQVDPREHPRRCRCRRRRPTCRALKENKDRREAADDARADGGASRQSGLRELPQDAWTRSASRSRTSTPSGAWRTRDAGAPIDASGELADGTKVERRGDAAQGVVSRPEMFVGTLTEKLLIYALGRGLDYRDMPAVRGNHARGAAQNNYRFSSLDVGHRAQHAVPDAHDQPGSVQQQRPMINLQDIVPRGRSCGAWARPSRCRSSMRWCRPSLRSGKGGGNSVDAFRRRLHSERRHHAAVDSEDHRRRVRVHADPEAAGAVQGFAGGRQQPDAVASGQPGRRSRRQLRGFLTGVWPKRTEAEDVLANTTIDQVVAQEDRAGHAAAVARARDRRFHRLRRRLFARLQLRLHEHDLVEVADDAAADGDQPADGVRAAVRRRAPRRAPRAEWKQRSILDSIAEDANDLRRDSGRARSRAGQRISRQRS